MLIKLSHLKLIRCSSLPQYKSFTRKPPMARPRFGPKSIIAVNHAWSNIEMDITLELRKIETQMRCHFLLIMDSHSSRAIFEDVKVML